MLVATVCATRQSIVRARQRVYATMGVKQFPPIASSKPPIKRYPVKADDR